MIIRATEPKNKGHRKFYKGRNLLKNKEKQHLKYIFCFKFKCELQIITHAFFKDMFYYFHPESWHKLSIWNIYLKHLIAYANIYLVTKCKYEPKLNMCFKQRFKVHLNIPSLMCFYGNTLFSPNGCLIFISFALPRFFYFL